MIERTELHFEKQSSSWFNCTTKVQTLSVLAAKRDAQCGRKCRADCCSGIYPQSLYIAEIRCTGFVRCCLCMNMERMRADSEIPPRSEEKQFTVPLVRLPGTAFVAALSAASLLSFSLARVWGQRRKLQHHLICKLTLMPLMFFQEGIDAFILQVGGWVGEDAHGNCKRIHTQGLLDSEMAKMKGGWGN